MKQLIENFCKGMYDSLTEQQKAQISYKEIEDVVGALVPVLISKLIMVGIALIVSIPFIIKFHISNGMGMWILEMCLWGVWIKETTNWTDYKALLKKIKNKS